ncbi:nucleotidyltransferase domain-containing protein [Flammeovirga pectinis]|uniref:Nucleotidyltransferase domain-containing protein n=1 Tax=Flammeovirga pectinis TaxID=2494373 RepID=A0A3S9P020_9BACT|nr:nucleotidyltransferase domain-containing protein [Flammeovirga pectinis]AZQ61534.1 nucleotidyltransferase domain-containing protein [Flammeovirga pectinis]
MGYIDQYKGQIIEICKKLPITKLYVFGSVVTDKFTTSSDIDFIVKLKENISFEDYSDSYFNLQYALRNLFKREIDVVTEPSIQNPYFKKEVDETKLLIYEV